MKLRALAIVAAVAACTPAFAQVKGPSTGSTPYNLPVPSFAPYVTTYSLVTVDNTGANADDSINGYGMVGIPDGTGAYDNGDRTFTVLVNHELGNTAGVIRAHGARGAFVSEWVVNKDSLAVSSGRDLIQNAYLWNGSGYTVTNAGTRVAPAFSTTVSKPNNTVDPTTGVVTTGSVNATNAFARFCSADLALPSAYKFTDASGNVFGTDARIFLNGEETGVEGRSFAHIATGTSKGNSYELPLLGKWSVENNLASPFAQKKTVVIGSADDGANPGIWLYVGEKTNAGTEVDKAGLTNGSIYTLRVPNLVAENRDFGLSTTTYTTSASYNWFKLGDSTSGVANESGASQNSRALAAGSTVFSRPEDGAWNPLNPNEFYFVTTDRYDNRAAGGTQNGATRLWKLTMDIANPENGGVISLVVDGANPVTIPSADAEWLSTPPSGPTTTIRPNMWDNLTIDNDGKIWLQEDVGNQTHNGKTWVYDTVTGKLELALKHDRTRFGDLNLAATTPFSRDEEGSGIIEITALMKDSPLSTGFDRERWYLAVDQAHYTTGITTAQVEGGQVFVVRVVPEPTAMGLLVPAFAMLGRRRSR